MKCEEIKNLLLCHSWEELQNISDYNITAHIESCAECNRLYRAALFSKIILNKAASVNEEIDYGRSSISVIDHIEKHSHKRSVKPIIENLLDVLITPFIRIAFGIILLALTITFFSIELNDMIKIQDLEHKYKNESLSSFSKRSISSFSHVSQLYDRFKKVIISEDEVSTEFIKTNTDLIYVLEIFIRNEISKNTSLHNLLIANNIKPENGFSSEEIQKLLSIKDELNTVFEKNRWGKK